MVSITIVTWNSAQYLEECFASIEQQDYRDLEVIIVDNASTDGTREILRRVESAMASDLQRSERRICRRTEPGDSGRKRRLGALP